MFLISLTYNRGCQIAKIGMMAPKDVRALLAVLVSESLISVQDVPKSADRSAARTFYLWYVTHFIQNPRDDIEVRYNAHSGMLTYQRRTPFY